MLQNNKRKDCYRSSASVIIAVKNVTLEDAYDYKLLLFERTPQTALFPNHCVFPGGALDASDESVEWLKYFKEFGITEQELQALIVVNDNRPPSLAPQGTGCYDRFFKKSRIWARDISLRITALREVFEEVGILLSRSPSDSYSSQYKYGHANEDFDRQYWQQLVHNDASKFLELCRKLNVVPDLWCLKEWSAWRTSATAIRKFETIYYFVALEKTPNLVLESNEVVLAMWHSPQTFLRKHDERVIWLPIMIFYELARLTNVRDQLELLKFAYERGKHHSTTLLMPAFYRCTDFLVAILPGDDAYPSNPESLTESVPVDTTVLEFRKGIKNSHRVIYYDLYNYHVDTNIQIDGHLPPIRSALNNSKL